MSEPLTEDEPYVNGWCENDCPGPMSLAAAEARGERRVIEQVEALAEKWWKRGSRGMPSPSWAQAQRELRALVADLGGER